MASKNLKRVLVCFPLLLSSFFFSCGKNPISPVTDLLQNLQRLIMMKDIPAGTFCMGTSDTNFRGAQPPHQVTVSAFRMQETKVTQELYLAVMDTNPAYFKSGLSSPVDNVNWYDAVRFCNTLSKLSGLPLVYDTSTWAADFTKNGYRLPTEAEWEYACQGVATTTQPVVGETANVYGLYDMSGSDWEWCNDWYGAYSAAATTDPTGPATGEARVQRGGVMWNNDCILNFAGRNRNQPDFRFLAFGFRCVCSG
jgi:formylglycine-generating enzyme required for sulfatase activity